MTIPERDALLMAWMQSKLDLDRVKTLELKLRNQSIQELLPIFKEGTHTLILGGGYKANVTYKLNYSWATDINAIRTDLTYDLCEKTGISVHVITDILDRLIKIPKPEISLTELKRLDPVVKATIMPMLRITEATPTLEIVLPKEAI